MGNRAYLKTIIGHFVTNTSIFKLYVDVCGTSILYDERLAGFHDARTCTHYLLDKDVGSDVGDHRRLHS